MIWIALNDAAFRFGLRRVPDLVLEHVYLPVRDFYNTLYPDLNLAPQADVQERMATIQALQATYKHDYPSTGLDYLDERALQVVSRGGSKSIPPPPEW